MLRLTWDTIEDYTSLRSSVIQPWPAASSLRLEGKQKASAHVEFGRKILLAYTNTGFARVNRLPTDAAGWQNEKKMNIQMWKDKAERSTPEP